MEDAEALPAHRVPDPPAHHASAGPELLDTDDELLLAGLRAGDPRAFETLVHRHGPRMRAAISRVRGGAADVDDTLQDAFISAFRAVTRFEGRSKLSTWLHRIAINAALMRLRARRDEPTGDVEELMPRVSPYGAFAAAQQGWVESPEDALQREELRAQVRSAIARLPENYRIPLVLRDIEGLEHSELAEALGCSVNAAKIRVHRARQALKTLLEQTVPGLQR